MNAFSQTHSNHHAGNVDALKMLIKKLGTYVAEIAYRRKIKRNFANLSEQQLRDIGLTPNDILSATKLPVSSNCATVLSITGKSRSRDW